MCFDKVYCFFGYHSRTFKERKGMRYWSDCMVCNNPGYVEEVNMVDMSQVIHRLFNEDGELYRIQIKFNSDLEARQFIHDLWHCVDPNCGTSSDIDPRKAASDRMAAACESICTLCRHLNPQHAECTTCEEIEYYREGIL